VAHAQTPAKKSKQAVKEESDLSEEEKPKKRVSSVLHLSVSLIRLPPNEAKARRLRSPRSRIYQRKRSSRGLRR